jgi:hypothetical protein
MATDVDAIVSKRGCLQILSVLLLAGMVSDEPCLLATYL